MVTLKADNRRRIQLPNAKPGQVFIYDDFGDGSAKITLVKPQTKEPFPEGSLTKYWTAEKSVKELAILKGCVQGPSVEDE